MSLNHLLVSAILFAALLGTIHSQLVANFAGNDVVYPTARTGFCPREFVNVTGPVLVAYPTSACEEPLNGAYLNGAIVIVDKGTCSLQDKIRMLQKYGAIAVLYRDTGAPALGRDYASTDGKPFDDLVIPCSFISIYDGYAIEAVLAENMTVMGSVSAQIGDYEMVYFSDATMGIWITIHVLHVGVIALGVVLLIQNIRSPKPLKRKILPLVIIPLIIGSCILRIFTHLMSAYAQVYTISLPSRALNPHWTVPTVLYALAESLLQVGYCVLAFSWYSAISKHKIVPDAIKRMRKPVMIAAIVIASVQVIGMLIATLLWVDIIVLVFGLIIMTFWFALTITYIVAAVKLYKALIITDRNAVQSEEHKRKIRLFIKKVIALTIAFFLNFAAGLLQVTVGGIPLVYYNVVYPFIMAGGILASMVITMLAFFRIQYAVQTSSHNSSNNTSKNSKHRSNTNAMVPVVTESDTTHTEQ